MATDILMVQTVDGGDLVLQDNDFLLTSSLENQVPLYLFAGNVEQDTKEGDELNLKNNDWWGNSIIDTENFNSTFERTLRDVVLNSQGRASLINAAKTDLQPLYEFAELEIDGFIPKHNQFILEVKIIEKDKKTSKSVYLFEGASLINIDVYK